MLVLVFNTLLVIRGCTAKLAGGLHTYGYRKWLGGLGAEVTAFICIIYITCGKPCVVIILFFLKTVVSKTAIVYHTVNLHPSVGERYVLKNR